MSLIRKQTALAWELRGHALHGREVVLALNGGSSIPRLRGYVVGISATDSCAEVDDARWPEPRLVPLDRILSVRRPHFHEDGEAPARSRPVAERATDPAPFPGQLRLGGDPPAVSRRSRAAVERAAGMLLPGDLMGVLGALDAAVRGRRSVQAVRVAEEMGRSGRWTILRLARLAEMGLARVERERRVYVWWPGE